MLVAASHQPLSIAASIPLFSSHVSMYPKRNAADHLRRCTKRPVSCALGCGDGAVHSVPEDELAAHVHDAWVRDPGRVELQVKRMIVAAAGREIG